MTQKLLDQIERDMRNAVVLNQMLKLNRRQKLMVHLKRINYILIFAIAFCLIFWITVISAFADEQHIQCPDPGVKCKVLFLSAQEEQMLMTQNGILDTAAQGRQLDLGQFSVYLKTRITAAMQGEVKPLPPAPTKPMPEPVTPAQPQTETAPSNKSAAPVDNK
jgi:hypothetical protein